MPIYVYRCAECAERFEDLIRTAAEADSVRCPSCESSHVERQPTTFAVGSADRAPEAPFCNRCGEDRPPCGR